MVAYSYFYAADQGTNTWRVTFVTNVHYFCLFVVLVEMAVNKIRIPFHHVLYNILLTAVYFLCTYIGQILDDDLAVYLHDLNWNCQNDFSYYVNITRA